MTCLSILREGAAHAKTVAANPIWPLDAPSINSGGEFRFEVFDVDASQLKAIIGAHRCFYINETSGTFWARLQES